MWKILFCYILSILNIYCLAELSVSPLTKLRTAFGCHKDTTNLIVQCELGQRIRILEAFYAVSLDPNRDFCQEGYKEKDCKSYTNLQSSCNGKTTCSVSLFEAYISDCNANSHYLTVYFECIPEFKIHSVCSNIEDYSSWGTLQTTEFPQPYTSNENCWCKLSSNTNQRIVLSVITFQLFPYDPTCSEAGLYLQSDRKRSKECTLLQQGHYYISSSSNLFVNFYSKSPNVRGGFWLIYEASDTDSKIHLKCGDTDEVRPPDFARFTQSIKTFTTNYLFDLTNTTTGLTPLSSFISSHTNVFIRNTTKFNRKNENFDKNSNLVMLADTTTPSVTDVTTEIDTTKILHTYTLTFKRLSTFPKKPNVVTKPIKIFDYFNRKKTTDSIILTTLFNFITDTPTIATTKTTTISTSEIVTETTTTTATTTTKTSIAEKLKELTSLPEKIETKTYSFSKYPIKPIESLFNKTTLSNLKRPVLNNDTFKKETNAKSNEYITDSTTPKTTTSVTTPFTIKLKKFTLKIPGLLSERRFNGKNKTQNSGVTVIPPIIGEVSNLTNSTNEELLGMLGYLENTKKEKTEPKTSQSIFEKKLGKTELTIIISCVLFITLLTFVNLIIYALRKVVKRTSREVSQGNLTDKGKKSYDILPGVGEIILWAAKDKRGYLIDINGSWAKIDGQRWIRENMAVLHNTYKKASMAYRNRFKKKDDKKYVNNKEDDRLIKGPPPTNGACSLPPVPEAAEYEISDNTSSVSTTREENQATESEYQENLSPKAPTTNEIISGSMYNVEPTYNGTNSVAYQIQSSDVVTSDGDATDSNYYQEKNESWQNGTSIGFSHVQINNEKSISPFDILPPPPPIIVEGTSETVSSDDTEGDSAIIIKRPILIRGDADFLKNFPCKYANEVSDNGFSDSQDYQTAKEVHCETVFQQATEHIENESIVKTMQITDEIEIHKISEQIEPIANFKHARVIAQPIQRNSADIIVPETNNSSINNNNNNSTVKLDPSILKFTNQPVAIVAPSKSNHNSLERKKLHSNEGITCLSLTTVNINEIPTDSDYDYTHTQTVQPEIIKNFASNKSSPLRSTESIDKKEKEFVVANVQNCVDNDKILLKALTESEKCKLEKKCELSDLSYKDSGFMDDKSICSTSTITSTLLKPALRKIEPIEREFNSNLSKVQRVLNFNNQKFDEPLKQKESFRNVKKYSRFEDLNIDKESSSSDIDEIARFNQMELRRQAIKSKRKNFNNERTFSAMNTVPKPKPRLSQKFNERQRMDVSNLTYDSIENKQYDQNPSQQLPNIESTTQSPDIYNPSPMLNSCGLIMCSTLPGSGFNNLNPPLMMPTFFSNNENQSPTQMFVQHAPNAAATYNSSHTNTSVVIQVNENNVISPRLKRSNNFVTKTVTFANVEEFSHEIQENKFVNLKKVLNSPDKNYREAEVTTPAWQKRQAVKIDLSDQVVPPVEVSVSFENINDNKSEEDNNQEKDMNSDEFQFFINAIEKLKAANLFHEDDLKKMTDEQIYEALIEHARLQKKTSIPVINDTHLLDCQSIDRDEEDLPIIMRNLHSVKSLKHYFEVKAKVSAQENPVHLQSTVNNFALKHTPSLSKQEEKSIESKEKSEKLISEISCSSLSSITNKDIDDDTFTKVSDLREDDDEDKTETKEVSVQTETNSQPPPIPPPLPEFLLKTVNTSESLKELVSRNSLLKHSESYKKRKGPIEIQASCCSPTPFNEHRDLHEKLIKEIHNKSMERSKKETNICLDERGNLIHKPVGRVYTSVKNQKLYRIKDNATISSVEIKEFPRFEYIKNKVHSKSADGILKNYVNFNDKSISLSENKENSHVEPTKIEVISDSPTNLQEQINSKGSFGYMDSATNELVSSMVLGTNLSEHSEGNEPIEITQSFITQNSCSDIISISIVKQSETKSDQKETTPEVDTLETRCTSKAEITNERGEVKQDAVAQECFMNKEDDENDQLSELVSISQVPTVFPTLDRKESICKSSSFKTIESSNLESVQEIRRAISFKSDLSVDALSLKSTRSMLSEAKAKLELLSSKLSKNNESNNNTLKIEKNNDDKKTILKINEPESKKEQKELSRPAEDNNLEDELITQF